MRSLIRLDKFRHFFWLSTLAFLAVGAKNFEPGLSVDGPLYCQISKNIVLSGEWFRLTTSTPFFSPFFEHPHLHFWLTGLVMKGLGFEDWAARILGHIFYLGFLIVWFEIIKNEVNRAVATYAILSLWVFDRFSSFFSRVYLDPGCLFFMTLGFLLVQRSSDCRKWSSFFAGVAWGLGFVYKGFAALPLLGVQVCYLAIRRRSFKVASLLLLGTLLPLVTYGLLVHFSSYPDFFSDYWTRHFEKRLSSQKDFFRIFYWVGWKRLLYDSHFLLLVVPCYLGIAIRSKSFVKAFPLLGFFLCCYFYSVINLSGDQYWIYIFPWIAWMIGDLLGQTTLLRKNIEVAERASFVLAVLLLFSLQYTPVQVHRAPLPEGIEWIRTISKQKPIYLLPKQAFDFTHAGAYAWYSDRMVSYYKQGDGVSRIYVLDPKEKSQWDRSLCLIKDEMNFAYYLECDSVGRL